MAKLCGTLFKFCGLLYRKINVQSGTLYWVPTLSVTFCLNLLEHTVRCCVFFLENQNQSTLNSNHQSLCSKSKFEQESNLNCFLVTLESSPLLYTPKCHFVTIQTRQKFGLHFLSINTYSRQDSIQMSNCHFEP